MNTPLQKYITKRIRSRTDIHAQFKINMWELELCSLQGPSPLACDAVHPLLGQRILVTKGHHKGYAGHIRDVGCMEVTVEFNALMAGTHTPFQQFKWGDFIDV